MRFHLKKVLTEEDYLEFNCFCSLKLKPNNKQHIKARVFMTGWMIMLAALVVWFGGWTYVTVGYAAIVAIYVAVHLLFYDKIVKRNIKKSIKRTKRAGKLPFDYVMELEFYDDKLIEITATSRTEMSYDKIERICVSGDKFIYLFVNSIGGYILPIPQIKEQVDSEDFFNFITQKCSVVEYY